MSSTPPLAWPTARTVGLPPVMVTVGVVKPYPASLTEMPVMTPVAIWAVALASEVGVTPGDVIDTFGVVTYPAPGLVTVTAETAPVFGSTVAVACAAVEGAGTVGVTMAENEY